MTILEQLSKVSSIVHPITINGETFYIRVMSGIEREEWEHYVSTLTDTTSRSQTYAQLLVRTLSDAQGNRELTDANIETLISKNSKALKELFDKAFDVNRIGEAGIAAEKKDSVNAQTSDSGLGSLRTLE